MGETETVGSLRFIKSGGVDIQSAANEAGWIAEDVYNKYSSEPKLRVCEKITEVFFAELAVWEEYLSAISKGNRQMYQELYRYQWYEGWNRQGFWGNIEDAIRRINIGSAPRIAILSAGVGRDIAKVGLAAGIWKSSAPKGVRGTHKEITDFHKYFSLVKPNARIMVTEYNDHSLKSLKEMVSRMIKAELLTEQMISVRQWDFRVMSPLRDNSQDLAVFSLTGNYAKIDEQSLILKEISRCVARGGHFVASTMRPDFDFNEAGMALRKIKIILSSPLMWPIVRNFIPWQIKWSQLAGRMNKLKHWQNVPASVWAGFISPVGMREVKIYSAPSKLVPVEVLVAQKE